MRHALAPLVRKMYSFCKDRDRMRQRVVVFQTFYNFARDSVFGLALNVA